TVLGPFHIEGSPEKDFGGDMSDGLPGTPLYVTGSVRGLDGTARPAAAAAGSPCRHPSQARPPPRRSPTSNEAAFLYQLLVRSFGAPAAMRRTSVFRVARS